MGAMLTVLLVLLTQDGRAPVPDAAAQKQAEETIRGLSSDEYAKTPLADRQAVARKLLDQGRETPDDRAAQFVLFRESRDIAAQAGDIDTAPSMKWRRCSRSPLRP